MREYKLRVRARLDDIITVRANSRQEAEDSARNSYESGETPGEWLEGLVVEILEEGAEVEPTAPPNRIPFPEYVSDQDEFVAEKLFPPNPPRLLFWISEAGKI